MAAIHSLLDEYDESHQNETNKLVHWICVPMIMLSLIGLIASIPVPAFMEELSINWAFLFALLCLFYYFSLSVPLAVGMIPVLLVMILILQWMKIMISLPLWQSCLIIFALAWIGQFWGHKIEGKKPSFLKDLRFLLIGPVWLLSFIYKKSGVKY